MSNFTISLRRLVVLLLLSFPAAAVEVDLTRHFSTYSSVTPQIESPFFGVPGEARLLLSASPNAKATVSLNGEVVFTFDGEVNLPEEQKIMLQESNKVSVETTGKDQVTVRIKQRADITLNVQSRIHFNANVLDFEAARAFYGMLGFDTISGFPDTNTLAMARAIGIETPTEYDGSKGDFAGGYLLHGELIGPDGFWGGVIDLIEFTIPRNEKPPYESVNRLGMASAAMLTTDIDSDYAYMQAQGVEMLSAPVTRADGSRFLMFKDLDGVFYELIETEGEVVESTTTQIYKLDHVGINVSDLETSTAWYQMFGYEKTSSLPSTESEEVARAMGFDRAFERKGNRVTHVSDASTFELVQWITPFDARPPYPIPVNHPGIHRTAFATTDIEADVAALRAQGVEFVSPITPCCSGDDSASSIIAFYDPDGTIVELAQQPYWLGVLLDVIGWFRSIF